MPQKKDNKTKTASNTLKRKAKSKETETNKQEVSAKSGWHKGGRKGEEAKERMREVVKF